MEIKMKGLKEFQKFDLEAFLTDKEIMYLDFSQWYEYKNGVKNEAPSGIKMSFVIVKDDTKYSTDVNNEYEKFDVKVRGVSSVNIKKRSLVKIKGVAKVWGDFNQNLSIEATAKDIEIL